jgi:hypothetical protein
MVDSAARVADWSRSRGCRAVPDKGIGGAKGPFGGYRSGAAGRGQAVAGAAESTIYIRSISVPVPTPPAQHIVTSPS